MSWQGRQAGPAFAPVCCARCRGWRCSCWLWRRFCLRSRSGPCAVPARCQAQRHGHRAQKAQSIQLLSWPCSVCAGKCAGTRRRAPLPLQQSTPWQRAAFTRPSSPPPSAQLRTCKSRPPSCEAAPFSPQCPCAFWTQPEHQVGPRRAACSRNGRRSAAAGWLDYYMLRCPHLADLRHRLALEQRLCIALGLRSLPMQGHGPSPTRARAQALHAAARRQCVPAANRSGRGRRRCCPLALHRGALQQQAKVDGSVGAVMGCPSLVGLHCISLEQQTHAALNER